MNRSKKAELASLPFTLDSDNAEWLEETVRELVETYKVKPWQAQGIVVTLALKFAFGGLK